MKLNTKVKEQIARTIGNYFSTNEIVNIFKSANISTDVSLYAKWKITLDAFSKIPTEETFFHILEEFCHPLNFENLPDEDARIKFIEALNKILSYEDIEIMSAGKNVTVLVNGKPQFDFSKMEYLAKTSTDYIVETINFFKNEYNKAKISGLTYEYSLGENVRSEQFEEKDPNEYSSRLRAIESLKDAGLITEYKVEERVENDGYYIWDYAICKIDEKKLTQKEAPTATETNVKELTKKIIHEHTHRFENSIQEKEIGLNIKNIEDNIIKKNKKKIHLPKFKPTEWSKIEIRFLDERNVLITTDKKDVVSADYEILGFADEKRDKPNLAWAFFRGLAKSNGETKVLPTPIPDTIKQQKRQLSDKLKSIFKNDTDPFYDPTETHTYKIKLNLIPPQSENELKDNYETQEYLKETMTEEYEE